jgi:hypothetical protein
VHKLSIAREIMEEFAASTGLSRSEEAPQRYLWTDAFAVCNFLELYRQTRDEDWKKWALALVDQVHNILGRHRRDDPRNGWISGLPEKEGKRHPTVGGLRIGKQLRERKPSDPYDARLEWERDGQYFHYLTKWMHALSRVSRSLKDPTFNAWAVELAKGVHTAFVPESPSGSKRMYWKMSIDLSYPLVPFMGQHDPLDGLITYHQLEATAEGFSPSPEQSLHSEIKVMESLCRGRDWATDDPLGIGGMLWGASRMLQLLMRDRLIQEDLLIDLLTSSLHGLDACLENPSWKLPAEHRLAFRELGMAMGLHAAEKIKKVLKMRPRQFPRNHPIHGLTDSFRPYLPLAEKIEQFWYEPQNRASETWAAHLEINRVMLTTSLIPDSFLEW